MLPKKRTKSLPQIRGILEEKFTDAHFKLTLKLTTFALITLKTEVENIYSTGQYIYILRILKKVSKQKKYWKLFIFPCAGIAVSYMFKIRAFTNQERMTMNALGN